MTTPSSYAEQNDLGANSCVSADINSAELLIFPFVVTGLKDRDR